MTGQFVLGAQFDGIEESELPFLTNANRRKLEETLNVLQAQKKVIRYDKEKGILIHADNVEKARGEITTTLAQYHKDFPLKAGLQKEELRSRTAGANNQKLFNYLISQLSQEGVVVLDKETIRLKEHKVTLAQDQEMQKAREEITTTLAQYHKDFPLKGGLQKEELRSRTAGANNQKLFNYLISQLSQEGVVVLDKETIRLKEHKVTLAQDQEKTRREVEEIYRKSELQPPYFRDLKDKFSGNAGKDVLDLMVKDGVLVKVKEDLYFHKEAIEGLKQRLMGYLKDKGEIDAPQFKDMTNISRKYMIPLLEYFDACQLTMRVGDKRVLRRK